MNFLQLLFLLMLTRIHKNFVHGSWTFKCPCLCDFDDIGRKRVTCTGGRLKHVPVRDMDTKTQVSIFGPVEVTLKVLNALFRS